MTSPMGNFSFTQKNDLLRNIQLEASAGTGKTYSIERIVALLIIEYEVPIARILIVTFTKKAARELKDRVRRLILSALRKGEIDLGGSSKVLSERERENIHQAILDFEKASIFTIHSFCLNMLKAYPFESLSQFSMDMESNEDLTTETVRDYFRSIGEVMERGQLIKYKAFLEGRSFEDAVERLAAAVDSELFEPELTVLPREDLRHEILETVMAFNNEKGQLFEKWKILVSRIPDEEHLKDLGFSRTNNIQPKLTVLKGLLAEKDFISISREIAKKDVLKYLLKFHPHNIEGALKKGADLQRAAADPFTIAAGDFADLYLYDEDKLDSNLYLRVLEASFLIESYNQIRKKLVMKKEITGKLDFNDLIGKLHERLCGQKKEVRRELIREIQRRYRTVLIDEFQDTDSRQWDIFYTLFGQDDNHNFFLVGDPKQSIYRFRGADLEIYHKASHSDSLDNHFTLGKNFRSISPLVEGVNHLFSYVFTKQMHCGDTANTPFQPVEAGRSAEPALGDHRAAIEFLSVKTAENPEKGLAPIKAARDTYFQLIAYKIYLLLTEKNTLGGEKIRPDHIAILTENNRQCLTLQHLLSSYSIPSVINARERIFDTDEALDFLHLFKAMVYRDNSSIKELLLSGFFPYEPSHVELMDQDGQIDLLSAKIFQWREDTDRGKLMEVAAEFFDFCVFEQRVLSRKNGERAYSNSRQLLEFLHREQRIGRLNTEELHALLLNRINGSSGIDEDLIRLDKDSQAVQIMTMHASKGLEFPIVFFAGALSKDKNAGRMDFYDYVQKGERYYDFLKSESHKLLSSMDLWEERKRLYYVALTRASSKLYLPLIHNCEFSYLSSLYGAFAVDEIESLVRSDGNFAPFSLPIHSGIKLLKGKKDKEGVKEKIRVTIDDAVMRLSKENSDLFSLDENLELNFLSLQNRENLIYREQEKSRKFTLCQFIEPETLEERYRKISSYSSIIRDEEKHHHSVKQVNDADHDNVDASAEPDEQEIQLTRGAVLGELVHLIFEELDYSLVEQYSLEEFCSLTDIDDFFKSRSVRFFDSRWFGQFSLSLKTIVYRTLSNGVLEDFSLSMLTQNSRSHEMEFHMTVKDCGDLVLGEDFSGAVEKGLLKGFIDLIFIHKGKYYIADWKTTSSPFGNSFDSYKRTNLDFMMEEHHYNLQSLIYTIALYRYLTLTKGEDFNYTRDYGGCFYLFVRGMSGERNSDRGVHFSKPTIEELEKFSNQFTTLEVYS